MRNYDYFEQGDCFALDVPGEEFEVPSRMMRLLEAADMEDDLPEVGGTRRLYFKKSEGWTRELMQNLRDVFNGRFQ